MASQVRGLPSEGNPFARVFKDPNWGFFVAQRYDASGKPVSYGPINGVPDKSNLARETAIAIYQAAFSRAKVIAVPTASGVLAGGPPATITHTFVNETVAIGALVKADCGDQTPLGNLTSAISYNDSMTVPNACTQAYTWRMESKNTYACILFGSFDGDISMPIAVQVGAGNPLAFVFTGPVGTNITTELLTFKHPMVRDILNSNLVPRLHAMRAQKG